MKVIQSKDYIIIIVADKEYKISETVLNHGLVIKSEKEKLIHNFNSFYETEIYQK